MSSFAQKDKRITTGQLRELLKQDSKGLVTRGSFDAFLKQGESRLGTAERVNRYFQKARDAAAKVEGDYQHSRAFAEIAIALAKAGDYSGARDAAAKVEGDYQRSRAFAEIAIAMKNRSS